MKGRGRCCGRRRAGAQALKVGDTYNLFNNKTIGQSRESANTAKARRVSSLSPTLKILIGADDKASIFFVEVHTSEPRKTSMEETCASGGKN